jgi:hypothetical protein
MVFHFPTKLTEEELMLQAKFAKLRKKKKQLAAHQNPVKNVEAEKSILVTGPNRSTLWTNSKKSVTTNSFKCKSFVIYFSTLLKIGYLMATYDSYFCAYARHPYFILYMT